MMVTINDINSAIIIMELLLAPIHIIRIGPSDTFGSELRMVKYGSITLAKK